MRILIISQSLRPEYGGPAFSEASLAGALSHLPGNQVLLCCREKKIDEGFLSRFGKFQLIPYVAREWIKALFNKRHHLRQEIAGADLVHINGHWRWENYFIARICTLESVPFVLQPRGMLWFGHRKVVLKYVFQLILGSYVVKKASRVIALSQFEFSHWNYHRLSAEKVQILPNGVLGAETASKDKDPRHLPKAPHGYFLYFGRLESRKNLIFLLQAFKLYRTRGGKAELWLVGPSERGYDQLLRKKILQLGLPSHARILPPVFNKTKSELLGEAISVIYPAIEEPFGRVPFEALDAGTFTVIPRRSGSAEYIEKFLPHLIYEDKSLEGLVEAIKRCEHPDPALKQGLKSAQNWVRKELHWENTVKKYFDLYKQLLPSSKSQRLVG